ncbi:thiamine-phosphate synthase [Flavobacterium psychrophilum]|nr:thiamine-phosphate synthase [Flavobacterium psychrophilum]AOE51530.1 thiamine-phosphate synthase [Flavobacterium psychrophilum]
MNLINKIQYISQGNSITEQINNIRSAVDAGCNWVQLRYKNVIEAEVLHLAELVKKSLEAYNCTFIVNDYPYVAKAIDADGIHLGLNDMLVDQARTILGYDKIIGGTANTLDDVLQRYEEKCDYVGLGPFRFTKTKEKLSPILGLEGFTSIMQELQYRDIILPVYAIGGIQQDDISSILTTGVHGVAVSGLVTFHPDKKELFNQLHAL